LNWPTEDPRKEPRGFRFVARRNNRVVEYDAHDAPPLAVHQNMGARRPVRESPDHGRRRRGRDAFRFIREDERQETRVVKGKKQCRAAGYSSEGPRFPPPTSEVPTRWCLSGEPENVYLRVIWGKSDETSRR
jgi:hypothetical protein